MNKFFYYLIQFTWGLPQNIMGFLLSLKYRKNKKEKFFNSLITYHHEKWGGISLGMFIIEKEAVKAESLVTVTSKV